MEYFHAIGEIIKFKFLLTGNGAGLTGLVPAIKVIRRSDGFWLQNGGGAFVVGVSQNNMSEVDTTNLPGEYEFSFDQSIWNVEETYDVYMEVNSGTYIGAAIEIHQFNEHMSLTQSDFVVYASD